MWRRFSVQLVLLLRRNKYHISLVEMPQIFENLYNWSIDWAFLVFLNLVICIKISIANSRLFWKVFSHHYQTILVSCASYFIIFVLKWNRLLSSNILEARLAHFLLILINKILSKLSTLKKISQSKYLIMEKFLRKCWPIVMNFKVSNSSCYSNIVNLFGYKIIPPFSIFWFLSNLILGYTMN